jgi:hypothetical protein
MLGSQPSAKKPKSRSVTPKPTRGRKLNVPRQKSPTRRELPEIEPDDFERIPNIDGFTLDEWNEAANQIWVVLGHVQSEPWTYTADQFPDLFVSTMAKNHSHSQIEAACLANDMEKAAESSTKKDRIRAMMMFALG